MINEATAFPAADQPTSLTAKDLWGLLDVQPDGPGRYIGHTHPDVQRPVIEGSQLLAQTLVAAARHVPGRRAVSASMVFARVASTTEPVLIDLDEVASGRTFTVFAPRITQGGRLCTVATLLLDATSPDLIRHEVAKPAVPGPAEATPLDLAVLGREVRIVDDAYSTRSDAPVGPPRLDAWIRFDEAPEDTTLNLALLTQITGFMPLAAALRPHAGVGLDQAHRTISTGVNAISLTAHADVRVDEWMLYQHHSTFAGDGMTHSECRVHSEAGRLLVSFTVEAMVRPMTRATSDGRVSM